LRDNTSPGISELKARQLSEAVLNKEPSPSITYRFAETRIDPKDPENWIVVFDRLTREGHLADGPAVVKVNVRTGKVRVLPVL
jgi:hypothetical protein